MAGCAAKPEAIMEGLYKAAQILEEKRRKIRGAAGRKLSAEAVPGADTASDIGTDIKDTDVKDTEEKDNEGKEAADV